MRGQTGCFSSNIDRLIGLANQVVYVQWAICLLQPNTESWQASTVNVVFPRKEFLLNLGAKNIENANRYAWVYNYNYNDLDRSLSRPFLEGTSFLGYWLVILHHGFLWFPSLFHWLSRNKAVEVGFAFLQTRQLNQQRPVWKKMRRFDLRIGLGFCAWIPINTFSSREVAWLHLPIHVCWASARLAMTRKIENEYQCISLLQPLIRPYQKHNWMCPWDTCSSTGKNTSYSHQNQIPKTRRPS